MAVPAVSGVLELQQLWCRQSHGSTASTPLRWLSVSMSCQPQHLRRRETERAVHRHSGSRRSSSMLLVRRAPADTSCCDGALGAGARQGVDAQKRRRRSGQRPPSIARAWGRRSPPGTLHGSHSAGGNPQEWETA